MMEMIASGSIPGLLAAISVMLSLQLLVKLGEILWKVKEKKETVTENGIESLSAAMQQNTVATEGLGNRIKNLEHVMTDVGKVKFEIRKLFIAMKLLADDRWDKIRKIITEDETNS